MNINVKEAEILQFYAKQAAEHPSERLTLRVSHIKDVVRHGRLIADGIGLDSHGRAILDAITYLHDYYQVLQIANNAPDPHIHHSDPIALEKTLFGNGKIDDYVGGLTVFDKEVIKTAIVQHAKIAVNLPVDASSHLILFCNLIRDADKSAIYELIEEPVYVLRNDHGYTDDQIKSSRSKDGIVTGVNPKVLVDFTDGRSILNEDIKTPADWAIGMLGYLYNVQTDVALKNMLQSAAKFVGNLPFSAEVNDVVRGCYYRTLNSLAVRN